MIDEKAAPTLIETVGKFISLVKDIEPQWKKAYLRFELHNSNSEIKGSIVSNSGVEIINTITHSDFLHSIHDSSQELLIKLGKDAGLFILIVDSDYNYEIKFEYQNMNKWQISKLDNGNGIPKGIN